MDTGTRERPASFGQCLRRILDEKGISASEAARLMGMKSRNGMFRMLSDEGSDSGKSAFFERFCESLGDRLDAHDRERLMRALDRERLGEDGFLQSRAMRMLLSGETVEEPPLRLFRQGKYPDDLSALLQSYVAGESLCMTVLGCCSRALFEQLAAAIAHANPQCAIEIEHYVYGGEQEIVGNLYAVRPLLGDARYKLYCIEPGMLSPQKEHLLRNSIAGISARSQKGRERYHYLMQVDPDEFHLIECRDGISHRRMRRVLQGAREKMRPMLSAFRLPRSPQDCTVYIEARLALEQGRELFLMRRTMPTAIMRPELFSGVFSAALERSGIDAAQTEAICAGIEALQRKRRNNALDKEEPTHAILTRRGLEELVRTGGHADLRYPAGPYEPKQRAQLLRQLREAADNPRFHLHVFRDGCEPQGLEIGLYGDAGALLSRPHTVCDELLITLPAFLDRYREYLKNELLARQVLPERDGIALLDALIAEAQALE